MTNDLKQRVTDEMRGTIALRLQERNRFIDMPTMRAIVDASIDEAASVSSSGEARRFVAAECSPNCEIPDCPYTHSDTWEDVHPSPSSVQTGVAERVLIEQLWGALNFILAFYEPGQRYLDTEAWKQAEAGGRRAHKAAREYLDAALSSAPAPSLEELRGALIDARIYVEMVVEDEFHEVALGHDAATLAKIDAALARNSDAAGEGK